MKKKVLSVLLSTAMITSLLVGCGGGGSGSQSAPAADGGSTEAPAVNVVETANMPTEKASPSCMRWTLIGGVLGCFAVCAVILVKYLMDDTIKSSEDIEKYLGLSTLALIPVQEDESDKAKRHRKKKASAKQQRRS